jgi:hypothetical protein
VATVAVVAGGPAILIGVGGQTMSSMNGLRVFIHPASAGIYTDASTFYSRRGNGPIYRWLYEEKVGHWRSLRINSSELTSRDLCNANWKLVPEKLQAQLGAHYLD